jgi:hypothetical protein
MESARKPLAIQALKLTLPTWKKSDWNVILVLNTSAQELERYVYDPDAAVIVIPLIGSSPN